MTIFYDEYPSVSIVVIGLNETEKLDNTFKAFYDARNPMLVILKHKQPDFFRKYFLQHFKRGVLRSSLVSLKQLRPNVTFAIWRGFISGIMFGLKNKLFTKKHFIRFKNS